MGQPMTPLERQLHEETLQGCKELAAKHKYNPTYFLRMAHEHGSVQAARLLLRSGEWQAGLTTLWELNKQDMSIEYAVLDPRYASLFTEEEKREARRRLKALGYVPSHR